MTTPYYQDDRDKWAGREDIPVALVALLGVALLTVAAHTVSLPITDPED